MLGNPKYCVGDVVKFNSGDEEKIGVVAIVDKHGTFFDDSDVSYDIMVQDENTLYKHFREDYILSLISHVDKNKIWSGVLNEIN